MTARWTLRKRPVALVLAACVSSGMASAQSAGCERTPLAGLQDAWLHSLASDGSSMLAVDPLGLRVLRLSPQDGLSEAFTSLNLDGSSTPFAPSLIQRVAGGRFLLGNGSDQILEVAPGPPIVRPKSALRERELDVLSPVRRLYGKNGTGAIIGMYGWAATADNHLIAFVDVKKPDGSYTSGFAWLEWRNPDSFELIREVDPASAETAFYFILHPYVAAIGNKGYFLAMEEEPTIYEFDATRSEGRRLRRLDMPDAFEQRPTLPPNDGTVPMEDLYRTIEASTTPYGLYAWRERLWLLGHRVLVSGAREWILYGIQPTGPNGPARVGSRVYLPTTADHLSLVFGPGVLSALEKGPVKVLGKQDVSSILRLSRWMLEAKASPLAARGASIDCR